MPSRMPEYRQARSHDQFVANINISRDQLEAALIEAWKVKSQLADWPRRQTIQLVRDKYATLDWTHRGIIPGPGEV